MRKHRGGITHKKKVQTVLQNQTRRLLHSLPKKSFRNAPIKYRRVKIQIPPFKNQSPGNDFYQTVNGHWLSNTSIPPYSSSYGVSEEVEHHIEKFLFQELYRSQAQAEKGLTIGFKVPYHFHSEQIGRLAMSALRDSKQKHNISLLKQILDSFQCIRDFQDVSRGLGYLCRYKIPSLLNISIYVKEGGDPSKSSNYRVSIGAGEIGLPDLSYYKGEGPGRTKILYRYTQLIQRATQRLNLPDLATIIPFEAGFAKGLDQADKNDEDAVALMSLSSLETKWNTIDWKALFLAFGIQESILSSNPKIEITSEEWITLLCSQCTPALLPQWRNLLSLHVLLHAYPYLPPPFDDWHHAFFGAELRGQRHKMPQDILTLNIVKHHMMPSLGYIFTKTYLRSEDKTQATQFVQTILNSAIERMKDIKWLSNSTRATAIEKLRKMRISAMYSEPLVRSPPLPPVLTTDNLLQNIYMLNEATTDRFLTYLVKDPPKGIWEEEPYAVNAYYYHPTNEIVIPAGSFLWPFYALDHPGKLGWNYGGLGAVIAHEITHAFDTHGKEYGPRGELKDWWKASNKRKYTQKTEGLIQLYSQSKVLGKAVDGSSTLNENLADLGGVAIALDALKRRIRSLPVETQKSHLRDFFVSYAVSWRTKEHPERRLQRLLTDKHAPIELRVNHIVSQFQEWYDAFQVQTSDRLYIPPEERIQIF